MFQPPKPSKTELFFSAIFTAIMVGIVSGWVVSVDTYSLPLLLYFWSQCQEAVAFLVGVPQTSGIGLLLILSAVVLLLVLRIAFSVLKTRRLQREILKRRSQSLPEVLRRLLEKYAVAENTVIVTTHRRSIAMTIGFFQPHIILSQGLMSRLSDSELESVFLHELYHLELRHGVQLLVSESVSVALKPLFPILQDLCRQMKLRYELAADAFAIGHQGTAVYLVAAMRRLKSQSAPSVQVVPHFASAIQERVAIHAHKKYSTGNGVLVRGILSVSVACSLMFIFTSTNNVQASLSSAEIQALPIQCQDVKRCESLGSCSVTKQLLMSTAESISTESKK